MNQFFTTCQRYEKMC